MSGPELYDADSTGSGKPTEDKELREIIKEDVKRYSDIEERVEKSDQHEDFIEEILRYVRLTAAPPSDLESGFGSDLESMPQTIAVRAKGNLESDLEDFGPYRWRVLTTNSEGQRLLLCDSIRWKMPYHERLEPTTWSKCTLRRWLNDDADTWNPPREAEVWLPGGRKTYKGEAVERFWPKQSFLELLGADAKRIVRKDIVTQSEIWTAARVREYWNEWRTRPEASKLTNSTIEGYVNNWMSYHDATNEDEEKVIPSTGADTAKGCRVFLLSLAEVEKYLPSEAERIANSNGAPGWWWLRSPGYYPYYAAVVSRSGWLARFGYYVVGGSVGVRPALWLNP